MSWCSLLGIWLIFASAPLSAAADPILRTFHYDVARTGWNNQETLLTPANVGSGKFRLLDRVPLDEQVDVQPLFMPGVAIKGSTYDVIYVATANKTVYAIDAASGSVLLSTSLGPAVPQSSLPGRCNNNSVVVGVNSTPVIDASTSTMYIMDYGYYGNSPVWYLHALDLGTLADKAGSPIIVQASGNLTNGQPYGFNPVVSRQRAALLEANGNIYAGFSSFCDIEAGASRGWVLGWKAASLTPLAANRLNDKRPHAAQNMFLSSVWMSGDGIAADSRGRIFFITGNSDVSGTSYGTVANLSESVIGMAPDLSQIQSFFTPSGSTFGVSALDRMDADFGSGGVMLLPPQPGTRIPLAVAAGKAGQMYLLNANSLGGYAGSGVDRVLGTYPIGPCWCGESYFSGPDGVGRVVSSGGVLGVDIFSSGGGQIMVWRVETSPRPTLVQESQSRAVTPSAQDGGFFTSVSSNGTRSPIVWAVGRPAGNGDDALTLYAYDPVAAVDVQNPPWLFAGSAGHWPHIHGNANIVPVAAAGRVYVASYKALDIFGLGSGKNTTARAAVSPVQAAERPPLPAGEHEIYGTIKSLADGEMTLLTRAGAAVAVMVRSAIDSDESIDLRVGRTVRVIGTYDAVGRLHAASIIKAKYSPLGWPSDR